MQYEVRKENWNEINQIAAKVKDVSMGQDIASPVPGGQVILENSPVGESQSNGLVENAIKEVQSQIRKLKDQLQQNMGTQLKSDDAIWPWLIEYAAYYT